MARQFFNLAEVMGQVDLSRQREQAIKSNEFDIQRQQREMERQAELDNQNQAIKQYYRDALVTNEDGTTKLDEGRLVQNIMLQNPEMGIKLQQQFDAQNLAAEKLRRENTMSDLTTQKTQLELDNLKNPKSEYNSGVNYDQSGKAFVTDKFGNIKYLGTSKAPETSNQPAAVQEYEYAKKNGYTGTFQDYKNKTESSYSTKPLPATSLKMQNEALDKLSIANNNNLKLSEVVNQIETGALDLGLFSNIFAQAKNYTGYSDESSRNLSSFKSTLERLRNDSLRLNAGVQTDGDAQRAWNELFENINDKELVKQRLKEIQEINLRGADLQKLQVENIRGNYNAEPIDFEKYEAKPKDSSILPKDATMPPKPVTFKAPPDPAQYKDKKIRDNKTGAIMQSDGKKWLILKAQ